MTDSVKWSKPWFRKLSPELKCFWVFLLDNCDCAGIWTVDIDLAAMFIGMPLDESVVKTAMAKQIVELNGGTKWFIPEYIPFQYGVSLDNLDPISTIHRGVLKVLNSYREEIERVCKPFANPLQRIKDKDKNKNKDQNKDQDQNKEKDQNQKKQRVERAKCDFIPPILQEVVDYFREHGFSETLARRAHESYSVADWYDSRGQKVRNWKQKMLNVWFKEENRHDGTNTHNTGSQHPAATNSGQTPKPGKYAHLGRTPGGS